MNRPEETVLLLFGTTHAAMEAEDSILSSGFWCDVVPKPPQASDSLCGLAIEVGTGDLEAIESLMRAEGIGYETYKGGTASES